MYWVHVAMLDNVQKNVWKVKKMIETGLKISSLKNINSSINAKEECRKFFSSFLYAICCTQMNASEKNTKQNIFQNFPQASAGIQHFTLH